MSSTTEVRYLFNPLTWHAVFTGPLHPHYSIIENDGVNPLRTKCWAQNLFTANTTSYIIRCIVAVVCDKYMQYM